MWRSLLLIAVFVPSASAEAPNIALLPAKIALNSAEARQTLIVQQQAGDQFLQQVRDGLKLTSSDEKIVRIEDGIAIPVANGSAKITAEAQGKSASAEVTVSNMDKAFTWNFRN